MISRLALLGIASLAIAASPALAVGKKKNVSWGKPGVSFVQYRADALDCANLAYGVQVQPDPERRIPVGYNGLFLPFAYVDAVSPDRAIVRTTTLVEAYRYAMRLDTIEQLQAAVDSCLVDRGYRRFRLTDRQMSVLRSLPKETPQRQHYLHSLGSSQDVLKSQTL